MSNKAEIEIDMADARKIIARRDALNRLHMNPDFQEVIGKGYFNEEPVRLVHLKADPHVQRPEIQADIIRSMDGIGALVAYFRKIDHGADQAEKLIASAEEALSEIDEEENEDASNG